MKANGRYKNPPKTGKSFVKPVRNPKSIRNGAEGKTKIFEKRETMETAPIEYARKGKVIIWLPIVADAISRKPHFSVINVNFRAAQGLNEIRPKVARKES